MMEQTEEIQNFPKFSRRRLQVKRLRCKPRLRYSRNRSIYGGAHQPLPQLDISQTQELDRALSFTKDYLEAIHDLLADRTAVQTRVGASAMSADDIKVHVTHVVQFESAIVNTARLRHEFLDALQGYGDIEDIFRRANWHFRYIQENIAPYFYMQMDPIKKKRRSLWSKKSECDRRYFDIFLTDNPENDVSFEPGQKVMVPYFPPWEREITFNVRETVCQPDGDVRWEGQVNLGENGAVQFVNRETGETQTRTFAFYYLPSKPCAEPTSPYLD